MTLSAWWGLKYLLLLLPGHTTQINISIYRLKSNMNLRPGRRLKYLLLLLPRHTTELNVRTSKLKFTHKSKSRVEIVNLATSATPLLLMLLRHASHINILTR